MRLPFSFPTAFLLFSHCFTARAVLEKARLSPTGSFYHAVRKPIWICSKGDMVFSWWRQPDTQCNGGAHHDPHPSGRRRTNLLTTATLEVQFTDNILGCAGQGSAPPHAAMATPGASAALKLQLVRHQVCFPREVMNAAAAFGAQTG